MCPLKLVDATDLLQAGQCLDRGAVDDGGRLGGGGDGDDMEDGGGGSVDREDDGTAAARGGWDISTARNARPSGQMTSPTTTGQRYRCLNEWAPVLVRTYAVCRKGVPTARCRRTRQKPVALCVTGN
jgi:hypothetical protein